MTRANPPGLIDKRGTCGDVGADVAHRREVPMTEASKHV